MPQTVACPVNGPTPSFAVKPLQVLIELRRVRDREVRLNQIENARPSFPASQRFHG